MKIKCRLEQCNGHDGSLRESKYRLDPGTAWVNKGPGETLSVLKAGNRAIENKRFSPCEQYIGARSEFETPNLWELMLLIIDYKPRLKSWGAIAVACLLSACSTLSPTQEPRSQDSLLTDDLTATTRYQALSGDIRPREVADKEPSSVILGSGEFVNTRIAGRAPIIRNEQGEITLNFELADIRDVVKVVFDTLQENYILDPGVQGEVTVQTSSPLPKDVLLPTLETPVDCWFLDGFRPASNPDMWSETVFANMARLSRDGASFATFTAAGFVRRGLAAAGFDVRKVPGYGRKREMCVGKLRP